MNKRKVGIVGGTGYTGSELLRLLLQHNNVEVICVTSRRLAGKAIYKTHPNLKGYTDLKFVSVEELIVANIVEPALTSPLMRIAENAGANGAVVAENVKSKPVNDGYNAATGEYVDMLSAGIVDPAKVTRSGLQNAASIAGMVLTTECIVADLPEKKDSSPAGGGMGGDFDY